MIASIDWVTLHQKFGFILVVAAFIGALVALISLMTPLVGLALKIYLRSCCSPWPSRSSWVPRSI